MGTRRRARRARRHDAGRCSRRSRAGTSGRDGNCPCVSCVTGERRRSGQTHSTRRINAREPVSTRPIPNLRVRRLRLCTTTLTIRTLLRNSRWRRTPLLVNNHTAPLAFSQTAMFEFEFPRDEVDGPPLGGREGAREGEFVAEGVGREEEDAGVQLEGWWVVHIEVVWRAGGWERLSDLSAAITQVREQRSQRSGGKRGRDRQTHHQDPDHYVQSRSPPPAPLLLLLLPPQH